MSDYLLPDWFSDRIPAFERRLSHFKGRPVQCIEIGVAEGRCTKWLVENILTHSDARIRCVDPWELKPFAEPSFDEKIGRHRQVIKVKRRSSAALKLLPLASFDFIYIDGNHEARYVLEDAVLSFPLLKPGGILAFDDYTHERLYQDQTPDPIVPTDDLLPPRPAIDAFLQMWEHCLDLLAVDCQVWVAKK